MISEELTVLESGYPLFLLPNTPECESHRHWALSAQEPAVRRAYICKWQLPVGTGREGMRAVPMTHQRTPSQSDSSLQKWELKNRQTQSGLCMREVPESSLPVQETPGQCETNVVQASRSCFINKENATPWRSLKTLTYNPESATAQC